MSDPSFISMLTRDYLLMVKPEKKTEAPSFKEAEVVRNLQSSKLVMNAETMFQEIRSQLDSSEFYQIMVDGPPGSGKSTLCREITHEAHKVGYHPLYSSGFDIMEAPEKFTEQAQGHDKVAIILDDLSYVMGAVGGRSQSKSKSFFMLIRHALRDRNTGQTPKVLLIVIAHFNTAVPPIFKNSNVWIFSKPTMLEYDQMVKLVGRKQEAKDDLERMFSAIVNIQAKAMSERDIRLNIAGHKYSFHWGSKGDPGDGRLMLLIVNSKAMIYNSQNVYCEACKDIGFAVQVRKDDYKTNRPSEDKSEKQKSDEAGTQ